MVLTPYKWSIEAWHELVQTGILDGLPVQLLNGKIIQMSPEGVEHFYTNDSVANYLRELLQGKAKVFESHPVTLSNSEPETDISIVRLPATIYRNHLPYPEDIYWLVEISKKTLKADREQKSIIYAEANIPEYWIIDLVNKKLIVYTKPSNNCYSQVAEYISGIVTPQAFPEVAIAIDELILFYSFLSQKLQSITCFESDVLSFFSSSMYF